MCRSLHVREARGDVSRRIEKEKSPHIPYFEEFRHTSFEDDDLDIWYNLVLLVRGADGPSFVDLYGVVFLSRSLDISYRKPNASLALLNFYNALLFTV